MKHILHLYQELHISLYLFIAATTLFLLNTLHLQTSRQYYLLYPYLHTADFLSQGLFQILHACDFKDAMLKLSVIVFTL
jgi:hypothetical protein